MKFIISLILLLNAFILQPQADAQTSFVMTPPRVEHKIKPGKQITDALLLTNLGDTPSLVSITASDWLMNNEGSVQVVLEGKGPDSASDWIKINPSTFTVQPGDHQQVRYTVSVPKGMEEKGYRSAMLIKMQAVDPSGLPPLPGGKGRSIVVHGQFNFYIYLTVGNPLPTARLNGFKANPTPEGLNTEFIIENSGKVHFRTKGNITIKNDKGKKVGTISIPSYPVLPGMKRNIKLPWKKEALPAGNYSLELRVDIGREALLGDEFELEIPNETGG